MITLVERLLLAGGVMLFGILVYRLGGDAVLVHLDTVGWGVVPIVLQEVLAIAANTAGWRAVFPSPALPSLSRNGRWSPFNNLLFFVPLRAGTQEAARVLAFTIVGLSPGEGLAAGILYRIVWACIGLVVFYVHRTPTDTRRAEDGPLRRWLRARSPMSSRERSQ